MAARTSIELQAGLCRLIHVDDDPPRSTGDVRVRRFFTTLDVDPESIEFSSTLLDLRRRHALPRRAAVTLWGLRSTHQCVRLPVAADSDLAAVAVDHAKEEIRLIEADGSRSSLAVTLGANVSVGDGAGREIALTAASESQIARRVEPITRAGFIVDRVLTPAMALASVARRRRDATPGTPSMYIALAARAICVAIVKDGVLLMARELPGGHAGPASADDARWRDDGDAFDQRLASELRRSLLCFRQSFRTTVESIVLCGDMIRLRRLTQLLGDSLDLPVQTLDSLTGIDAEAVPEPAAVFRADVAALRLAIAAGAEREPYSSLSASAAVHRPRYEWQAPISVAAAAVLVLIAGYVALRPSRSRPAPTLNATPLDVGVASTAPTDLQVPRPVAVERRSDVEPEIVVDSILYSPDRQLAVVNGQIARAGDRLGGLRIIDIQPRAVIVESPGRGRRTIEMRTAAPESGRSRRRRRLRARRSERR
jgi:hypothetical protein